MGTSRDRLHGAGLQSVEGGSGEGEGGGISRGQIIEILLVERP